MDATTDWVVSNGRYALDFDGVNDSVNCGTAKSATFNGNCTIAFWYYSRNANATVIMSHGDANPGWYFQQISGTTLKIKIAATNLNSNASCFASNTWTHIAFVQSGSSGVLYSNGGVNATFSGLSSPTASTGTLFFGQYTAGFYNSQLLDDVRIYNRNLSNREIYTLAKYRGITFEQKRRSRGYVAAGGGFKAAWLASRNAQLIGGGSR